MKITVDFVPEAEQDKLDEQIVAEWASEFAPGVQVTLTGYASGMPQVTMEGDEGPLRQALSVYCGGDTRQVEEDLWPLVTT